MARLASISIDLDGLGCYHAIHGLEPPPAGNPVYALAVPRFLELFEAFGIRATFFVITRDLDDEGVREVLAQVIEAGHEVASHTHSHPYHFGQLSREEMAAELDVAKARLVEVVGAEPIGFRAPGYNLADALLGLLAERGYRYDSSVFPCPPYYLAKAAVMTAMRIVGRRSGSALTDPRAWLAPLQPYRPSRRGFHRPPRGGEEAVPLWEVPMCVVPWLRLPVIGTSLALFGARAFSVVYPWIRHNQPFLNLEFHGIDLLDPSDPGVAQALVRRQPDLRRGLDQKIAVYRAVFGRIAGDYRFATLAEMAETLERERGVV
jgi:hypothetical protein